MRALMVCLALTHAGMAHAAIEVDGALGEPEWQGAQRFSDFRTAQPHTQAPAALATEARVHTDPAGIYIAFVCSPRAGYEPVRTQAPRDQILAADHVTALVDFEGRGTAAYEFSVSIAGSIRDSAVSRQTEFNADWDAAWDHAVVESGGQWTVEIRLPWTIAPMSEPQNGRRTLGFLFSRAAPGLAQRYGLPPHQFERATLVADLMKIEVASFSESQFEVYPYGSAAREFAADRTTHKIGADLFWKPMAQHQLAATLNPDFGQVESDELVVNFSAIPTFFPDKRPFFAENLGLFDTDNRVLYTRRIGAAPDLGAEGASDITGAVKYGGSEGATDLGLVLALEDDSRLAEGRDFYVGRIRHQVSEALTLGWLGTHVERPALQRRAQVQALDAAWSVAPGVALRGQALYSDIRRPATLPSTPLDPAGRDSGGSLVLLYTPGEAWEHIVTAQHFGSAFQLDDAGFLERNNLNALTLESARFFREQVPGDRVQERVVEVTVNAAYNDRGERLPVSGDLTQDVLNRDSSGYAIELSVKGAGGADDLLTRGNGPVKTPAQRGLAVEYFNPQTGFLRYNAELALTEGLFHGVDAELTLSPELHFSPAFNLRLVLEYRRAPDLLIWQELDDLVATFRYREVGMSGAMDWFPAPYHEVRLLVQASAGSGAVVQAYRPDADGRLRATADPVGSFSFSETALQIRYRYEFAPLSDLHLVYSRGGEAERDDTGGGSTWLLREGLRRETASQLLLKLRCRFGGRA